MTDVCFSSLESTNVNKMYSCQRYYRNISVISRYFWVAFYEKPWPWRGLATLCWPIKYEELHLSGRVTCCMHLVALHKFSLTAAVQCHLHKRMRFV